MATFVRMAEPITEPTPLVCAECLRADRDGDRRGGRADWAGGHDDEKIELLSVDLTII